MLKLKRLHSLHAGLPPMASMLELAHPAAVHTLAEQIMERQLHAFLYISNTFIISARLKFEKIKQKLSNTLRLNF